MAEVACRCGWSGEGDHLCHRCGKVPGSRRFYPPTLKFSLAGAQPKFSVRETWGCDACWKEFEVLAKQAQETKDVPVPGLASE